MQINSAKCARLKTAIATETGNIQGMSERFIAEADEYLTRRIPSGTYNVNAGENPRKVRYSTAPIEDTEYGDLLTQGSEAGTMPARDTCSGETTDFSTTINTKGAFGCNIPGSGIHAGYDEFTRVLKGKAFETDPVCVLELLQKMHYNEYVDMLRNDLPRRAKEQFEYSLQRNVIETGRYNTSVVSAFTHSSGMFPAKPTGALDLGTVRRVFALLRAQGWTGTPEVGPISHSAFETMRRNYKASEGLNLEATLVSSETRFVDNSTTTINWGGINWVLTDTPLRGYLVTLPGGGSQLMPIRPTIARSGTGEGIVTDVNDDYFNCSTVCDGARHELYEVGFYVHPTAATREGFAVPQVAGKRYDSQLFNFSVRMLDGNDIECNRDNFKFLFRILHAYAFESLWPERMGAIIYRVSPDCVNSVAPCCDDDCAPAPGNEIGILHPNGPVADECSSADCDPTACDNDPVNHMILGTETNNCVAADEGLVLLGTCGPIVTDTAQGEVCVYVRRSGGSLGIATVDYTTVNGTAIAGVDYTLTAGTLTWADGENDTKKVCVPILAAGAGGGLMFDFSLANATGAGLADGVNGCNQLTIQIESPCTPYAG